MTQRGLHRSYRIASAYVGAFIGCHELDGAGCTDAETIALSSRVSQRPLPGVPPPSP